MRGHTTRTLQFYTTRTLQFERESNVELETETSREDMLGPQLAGRREGMSRRLESFVELAFQMMPSISFGDLRAISTLAFKPVDERCNCTVPRTATHLHLLWTTLSFTIKSSGHPMRVSLEHVTVSISVPRVVAHVQLLDAAAHVYTSAGTMQSWPVLHIVH